MTTILDYANTFSLDLAHRTIERMPRGFVWEKVPWDKAVADDNAFHDHQFGLFVSGNVVK
jgi:hypothetical protein